MDPVVGGGGTSLFEPRFQRRVGVNLTLVQMQLSPPWPGGSLLVFSSRDPVVGAGGQVWLLPKGPGGGTNLVVAQTSGSWTRWGDKFLSVGPVGGQVLI